jgi:hypothetical protein
VSLKLARYLSEQQETMQDENSMSNLDMPMISQTSDGAADDKNADKEQDMVDMVDVALGDGTTLVEIPINKPFPDDEESATSPQLEIGVLPVVQEVLAEGEEESVQEGGYEQENLAAGNDKEKLEGENEEDNVEDGEAAGGAEGETESFAIGEESSTAGISLDLSGPDLSPPCDAATVISSIGSVSARQSFFRQREQSLRRMSRYELEELRKRLKDEHENEDDEEAETIEDGTVTSNVDDEGWTKPAEAVGFRGSCLSHPCGRYEFAAVMLAFLAFLLCLVSTDRCDFVVLDAKLPTFFALPKRDVGLLQFETIAVETLTSKCMYWFDDPDMADIIYDPVWHAARVMSVTATFLGLFLVGFICTVSCISYEAIVFQKLALFSLSIPLLYGLSFIVLGSDVCLEGSCELGIGGLVLILGIIVWMMLAVVLYLIPGVGVTKTGQVTKARRSGLHLGIGILVVVCILVLVDVSVIFGRSTKQVEQEAPAPTASEQEVQDWAQEGEITMGPYPDVHDYVTLAGNGRIMSLIGKESVLVMEYHDGRRLWYPLGNLISANLDPTGWDPEDRVTKVKATASSLSEDGLVVAVASTNWADGSNGAGQYEFGKVLIWMYHPLSSKRWVPLGHPITGMDKDDAFAANVRLSSDGRRLAVLAAGRFGRLDPYVRVYQYDDVLENNGNWAQLGQDLRLDSSWTPSGFAFSGDGATLALGSLRTGQLGVVTVWHYDDNTDNWNRRGSPITSSSSSHEDRFGEVVDISGDGTALIVGDPGGVPAYARALWFDGEEWKQLGQEVQCNMDGRCAHDVSISKFGSMIALTGYHGSNQVARVYSLDGPQHRWLPVGGDIKGPVSDGSVESTSVDLSSDGQTVAVGTTFQDTQTLVWQYTGGLFIDVPLENNLAATGQMQVPDTNAPNASTQSGDVGNTSFHEINDNAAWNDSEGFEIMADIFDANFSDFVNGSHVGSNETELSFTPNSLKPWNGTKIRNDFAFFLFDSFPPRVERYDLLSREFLLPVMLPESNGSPTAVGIDDFLQIYVGFGAEVYRYSFDGTNETRIETYVDGDDIITSGIRDFHFDGDIVFINGGQRIVSVNGRTNTKIDDILTLNELVFGTSISHRHKRIFGRAADEVDTASGDIIRRSGVWFKEYDAQGSFVGEKLSERSSMMTVGAASKTWMFPDETRLVDDHGYVFSVTNNAEHVYTVDTRELLDIAWVGDDVMIALHRNGSLSSISQELTVTGSLNLNYTPANIALNSGEVLTFTHDLTAGNGIRVDVAYLEQLNPSLRGRPMNPDGIPFSPEFPFVSKDGRLYMLSKGHASLFVIEPAKNQHLESLKLDVIPKYVAYSSENHEVYTLREDGVLSKIDLSGGNKTESPFATLPSTPLGLSTAGKFIFVCDDAGSFATHYTFLNDGTLVSSMNFNHIDSEYVWSEVNRKMYFFRQADPTDLMTEHIFLNGTIGIRVDSFLNNNLGFEHPIRVDPAGHRAVLGSGIIHNARTLERLNVTLANRVLDIAFNKGVVRTIRNVGNDKVQFQQWHGHNYILTNTTEVNGRGHRLFALDENKTIALVSNMTGVPMAYVLDELFNTL